MQSGSDKQFNRGILLVVIMISSFFNPFMGSAVNIALPSISRELSMDAVSLSWIAMSFLLSAAVFLVPFGKLADIWGRRRMLFYGNIFFTIASLFCAFSVSGNIKFGYGYYNFCISTGKTRKNHWLEYHRGICRTLRGSPTRRDSHPGLWLAKPFLH
jgi:MFS family permease